MNVLVIAFNRLELFERNLRHLVNLDLELNCFIHFDGPRDGSEESIISCQVDLVKNLVPNANILCQSSNLGCKRAVESAIDWFFANVKEGFIVEDDCILSKEFFTCIDDFSKSDDIDVIGAANFFDNLTKHGVLNSYPFMWGWWTKGAVWKEYRGWGIKKADHLQNDIFSSFLRDKAKVADEVGNTWDFQWLYWFNQTKRIGLTLPSNLVNNIGFSETATHTHEMSHIAKRRISGLKSLEYSKNSLYDWMLFIFILKRPFLVNMFYKLWKVIRRR